MECWSDKTSNLEMSLWPLENVSNQLIKNLSSKGRSLFAALIIRRLQQLQWLPVFVISVKWNMYYTCKSRHVVSYLGVNSIFVSIILSLTGSVKIECVAYALVCTKIALMLTSNASLSNRSIPLDLTSSLPSFHPVFLHSVITPSPKFLCYLDDEQSFACCARPRFLSSKLLSDLVCGK